MTSIRTATFYSGRSRTLARCSIRDARDPASQEHTRCRSHTRCRACPPRFCQYGRRCAHRVQASRERVLCSQVLPQEAGSVRASQSGHLIMFADAVYRLTLYDSSGKTGGVCAKAFDRIGTLLVQAADRVIECGCSDGCPRCKYLERTLNLA